MTLKSLLGSAAIAALAVTFSAPGVMAGDTNKSPSATQSSDQSTQSQGAYGNTQTSTQTGAQTQMGTESSTQASSSVALSTVTNPETTLANATLQDSQGASLGTVKNVKVGSNGHAREVNFDVGGKVVAIKANKLKFQQTNKILITTMTKQEVDKLPQAKGI